MTATFEKTGATTGTLTFSINQDLQKTGLDKAFNKQKGKITVPGFRKGKITRQMFDRLFGEEALYEEAVNAVLENAFVAALTEASIESVAEPKFEIKSMEKGKDWELTATVTTKPEVKLGQYMDLSVKVDSDTKVSANEIEERLKAAQERMAELVVKEGAAATGDTVVIDFVGTVDGVEFEGGKGSNHSLELGSGQFIPGFEDQLVGRKSGDEVEVKVTFPADYQSSNLAGKAAIFKTLVHEVKSKEVPELDDELAKDIDDTVTSVEGLKAKYKDEIKASKEEEYQDALETAAIEAVLADAKIDEIPASMIDDEVHRSMNEFLGGMQQQGISPEMYYQLTGTSEEDLHVQHAEDAEKRVRTNLVIEAIAKAEAFTVTKDEIESEVAGLSEQYRMPAKQIRQLLPESMLEHDIKMKKAIELITNSAHVEGAEKKTAKKDAAKEEAKKAEPKKEIAKGASSAVLKKAPVKKTTTKAEPKKTTAKKD